MIKVALDIRDYLYVYIDHEEIINKPMKYRPGIRSVTKHIMEKQGLELVKSKGIG